MILEPLHSLFRVSIPLLCPGWDPLLLAAQLVVKLLAKEMRPLADNEAAVLRAIREEVDETLQAAEARALRILILMRPGIVGGEIGAVMKAVIDGIEGHQEILRAIHLLKGVDDARFRADRPDKIFVAGTIWEQHAFLVDDRQFIWMHGRGISAIIPETTGIMVLDGIPMQIVASGEESIRTKILAENTSYQHTARPSPLGWHP